MGYCGFFLGGSGMCKIFMVGGEWLQGVLTCVVWFADGCYGGRMVQ